MRASPPPAAPRLRASACLLWGAVSIGTRGYLAGPPTPPSRRSTRCAPLGPPTRPRMFFLWGLRPHAPAGSAAPPKPRGRSGPLSPRVRVGVRARRGRRDASDLSLAACLSSFDGVCGSRAGAWGAAPTENAIEGGWGRRAVARARPRPAEAPRLRGRSSPRLCSVHAGVWGAQPPPQRKTIRGGWVGSRPARHPSRPRHNRAHAPPRPESAASCEGARALARATLALPEPDTAEDRAFALRIAAGPRCVRQDAVRQPREGQ